MPLFIPVQEAVELPLLGNDDTLQRGKGRMLKWAKYVYADMNLTSVKAPVRREYGIDKRTNTVILPKKTFKISSVEVRANNGAYYPVWRNEIVGNDLVEISAAKNCACEYKCGYTLCNTIKGYVAVVSTKTDKLPNGNTISFTCVDRQAVDANGFFYSETQYPLRVYESGVWVNTVLHTESKKLCKVEVDKNGCVCDTEQNITDMCNACGANLNNLGQAPADVYPIGGNAQSYCGNPAVNSWIYYCSDKADWFSTQCGGQPHLGNNVYNISELGDKLIFPHNFGFSKVVVRTYEEPDLNNLQIPFMAIDTFVAGLKWWDARWNDKKQALAAGYAQIYASLKFGLLNELNKYTIEELRMIFTPPTFVPSFITDREWR